MTLASAGDRLWLAASWSALDHEAVWLGEVEAGAPAAPVRVGDDRTAFRPAACALADGVLGIALSPGGDVLGVVLRDGRAARRWTLGAGGTPWQAALARDPDGAVWLGLEIRRAAARTIVLGVLDPERGRLAEIARVRGRWPALAAAPDGGVLLAWCEEPARVRLCRVDRAGAAAAIDADPSGLPGDAPALAVGDDGRVAVAWHAGGAAVTEIDERDASVRRSLRLARWDPARGAAELAPEPPVGADGLEPRGEDQGWELPAIAFDARGALWLAGRSSHGHHLARLDDAGWSARLSLCDGAWGGRGRRMALARRGDEVWLARRAPAGLDVRPCPAPGAADGPAPVVPVTRTGAAARPHASPPAVLFGDLHQHTAHSDGAGSAEDLWAAARRRGLDFAAITDHDSFCRRALGPATWRYLCDLADDRNEPGRFAALSAYEFTGPRHPGPGHKCVYFGDRVPDRVPDKDVDAIFAICRELGGIAVPHHVAWTGADFAHHDPEIQPVWEICSVHGCYTAEGGCAAHPPRADHVIPGHFVKDALDAGLRFGFIGSTDSHGLDWHHGIARWRNPFRSGLAAVFGAEPTRASILEAIRARRTYATTGARIALRVDLDGAPMGSELPAGTRGELGIEVTGTAAITRIVVVTTDGDQVVASPGAATATVRVPAPDARYFYVRVEQDDAELAWSSPIWIG